MTFEEKIKQLRGKIEDVLLPLIDSDYVLWDCPYHNNIGDILIWQGEIEFLQKVKHRSLDYASKDTCWFPKLSEDVVILLHGGGNFGDVWREPQDFRLKVVQAYPNNRIIIFPQTVYYHDNILMQHDVQVMAGHDNLVICARDQRSYEFLKKHFSNTILLLPDMAFCISTIHRKKCNSISEKKSLYLKRSDKEFGSSAVDLPTDLDVHDWPTFEKKYFVVRVLNGLLRIKSYCNMRILNTMLNCWAYKRLRRDLIYIGICFLSQYDKVYTTRLHVLISSILLGIECCVMDNSYGKNSSFCQTWLKDLQGLDLLE